jgi:heat shock protein HtpX
MGARAARRDRCVMRRQRVQIAADPRLQLRMLLTLALLGALYVLLGAVVVAAGAGFVAMGLVLAAIVLAQLFLSERLALRAMHARVVAPGDAPGLHALVERLAIQADVPMPRVAISELDVPNAFALGRSPRHATVCVTTALLRELDRGQLEAVLAHEIAHVRNRDVALMTLASFFSSLAALIAQWVAFGGFSSRDREGGHGLLAILAVSIAVYAISYVLMLALSRYREFAADRGAALLTGRPSALASALLRLDALARRTPERDLREVARLQALFIVPAGPRAALGRLFATHPSLEQRLERLASIEAQLQQSA